ncbi:MAG: hypothetical protein ABIT23_03085 [Nitrosospira sp.]
MNYLFTSMRKTLKLIVIINALILGSGTVHAQSQNPKDEYKQKPITTEKKPASKSNAINETKTGKQQSKQGSKKDTGNYQGAQPPQGGRLGQGPE